MKWLLPFLVSVLALAVSSCSSSGTGSVSYAEAPKFLNVSSWDPKERQRTGQSYSPLNQTSLRQNGSRALIARCAKGPEIDQKCGDFLVGAERSGQLLGAYYYLVPWEPAEKQAERFVNRLKQIKRTRSLRTDRILLVGDIDTNCNSGQIVRFIKHMEALTGKTPVIYLENSKGLQDRLRAAPPAHKKVIRRAPYWIALYSNSNESLPHIKTPDDLTAAYGIWRRWTMWQYGGVFWENGRSDAKTYQTSSWRAPRYFGNIDRPLERNSFNGSAAQFEQFWANQSWRW